MEERADPQLLDSRGAQGEGPRGSGSAEANEVHGAVAPKMPPPSQFQLTHAAGAFALSAQWAQPVTPLGIVRALYSTESTSKMHVDTITWARVRGAVAVRALELVWPLSIDDDSRPSSLTGCEIRDARVRRWGYEWWVRLPNAGAERPCEAHVHLEVRPGPDGQLVLFVRRILPLTPSVRRLHDWARALTDSLTRALPTVDDGPICRVGSFRGLRLKSFLPPQAGLVAGADLRLRALSLEPGQLRLLVADGDLPPEWQRCAKGLSIPPLSKAEWDERQMLARRFEQPGRQDALGWFAAPTSRDGRWARSVHGVMARVSSLSRLPTTANDQADDDAERHGSKAYVWALERHTPDNDGLSWQIATEAEGAGEPWLSIVAARVRVEECIRGADYSGAWRAVEHIVRLAPSHAMLPTTLAELGRRQSPSRAVEIAMTDLPREQWATCPQEVILSMAELALDSHQPAFALALLGPRPGLADSYDARAIFFRAMADLDDDDLAEVRAWVSPWRRLSSAPSTFDANRALYRAWVAVRRGEWDEAVARCQVARTFQANEAEVQALEARLALQAQADDVTAWGSVLNHPSFPTAMRIEWMQDAFFTGDEKLADPIERALDSLSSSIRPDLVKRIQAQSKYLRGDPEPWLGYLSDELASGGTALRRNAFETALIEVALQVRRPSLAYPVLMQRLLRDDARASALQQIARHAASMDIDALKPWLSDARASLPVVYSVVRTLVRGQGSLRALELFETGDPTQRDLCLAKIYREIDEPDAEYRALRAWFDGLPTTASPASTEDADAALRLVELASSREEESSFVVSLWGFLARGGDDAYRRRYAEEVDKSDDDARFLEAWLMMGADPSAVSSRRLLCMLPLLDTQAEQQHVCIKIRQTLRERSEGGDITAWVYASVHASVSADAGKDVQATAGDDVNELAERGAPRTLSNEAASSSSVEPRLRHAARWDVAVIGQNVQVAADTFPALLASVDGKSAWESAYGKLGLEWFAANAPEEFVKLWERHEDTPWLNCSVVVNALMRLGAGAGAAPSLRLHALERARPLMCGDAEAINCIFSTWSPSFLALSDKSTARAFHQAWWHMITDDRAPASGELLAERVVPLLRSLVRACDFDFASAVCERTDADHDGRTPPSEHILELALEAAKTQIGWRFAARLFEAGFDAGVLSERHLSAWSELCGSLKDWRGRLRVLSHRYDQARDSPTRAEIACEVAEICLEHLPGERIAEHLWVHVLRTEGDPRALEGLLQLASRARRPRLVVRAYLMAARGASRSLARVQYLGEAGAVLAGHLSRPSWASVIFRHACRSEDAPVSVLRAYVETCRSTGAYIEALHALERISRQTTGWEHAEAMLSRAELMEQLGSGNAEVLPLRHEVLRAFPERKFVAEIVEEGYRALGDIHAALQARRLYLVNGLPVLRRPAALDALADQIYRELDDVAWAVQLWAEATDDDPSRAETWAKQVAGWEARGDDVEALACCERWRSAVVVADGSKPDWDLGLMRLRLLGKVGARDPFRDQFTELLGAPDLSDERALAVLRETQAAGETDLAAEWALSMLTAIPATDEGAFRMQILNEIEALLPALEGVARFIERLLPLTRFSWFPSSLLAQLADIARQSGEMQTEFQLRKQLFDRSESSHADEMSYRRFVEVAIHVSADEDAQRGVEHWVAMAPDDIEAWLAFERIARNMQDAATLERVRSRLVEFEDTPPEEVAHWCRWLSDTAWERGERSMESLRWLDRAILARDDVALQRLRLERASQAGDTRRELMSLFALSQRPGLSAAESLRRAVLLLELEDDAEAALTELKNATRQTTSWESPQQEILETIADLDVTVIMRELVDAVAPDGMPDAWFERLHLALRGLERAPLRFLQPLADVWWHDERIVRATACAESQAGLHEPAIGRCLRFAEPAPMSTEAQSIRKLAASFLTQADLQPDFFTYVVGLLRREIAAEPALREAILISLRDLEAYQEVVWMLVESLAFVEERARRQVRMELVAIARGALDDPAYAVEHLRALVAEDPDDREAWGELIECLDAMGEAEALVDALALRIPHTHGIERRELVRRWAYVLNALGRAAEAAAWLADVRGDNRCDAELRELTLRAHTALGPSATLAFLCGELQRVDEGERIAAARQIVAAKEFASFLPERRRAAAVLLEADVASESWYVEDLLRRYAPGEHPAAEVQFLLDTLEPAAEERLLFALCCALPLLPDREFLAWVDAFWGQGLHEVVRRLGDVIARRRRRCWGPLATKVDLERWMVCHPAATAGIMEAGARTHDLAVLGYVAAHGFSSEQRRRREAAVQRLSELRQTALRELAMRAALGVDRDTPPAARILSAVRMGMASEVKRHVDLCCLDERGTEHRGLSRRVGQLAVSARRLPALRVALPLVDDDSAKLLSAKVLGARLPEGEEGELLAVLQALVARPDAPAHVWNEYAARLAASEPAQAVDAYLQASRSFVALDDQLDAATNAFFAAWRAGDDALTHRVLCSLGELDAVHGKGMTRAVELGSSIGAWAVVADMLARARGLAHDPKTRWQLAQQRAHLVHHELHRPQDAFEILWEAALDHPDRSADVVAYEFAVREGLFEQAALAVDDELARAALLAGVGCVSEARQRIAEVTDLAAAYLRVDLARMQDDPFAELESWAEIVVAEGETVEGTRRIAELCARCGPVLPPDLIERLRPKTHVGAAPHKPPSVERRRGGVGRAERIQALVSQIERLPAQHGGHDIEPMNEFVSEVSLDGAEVDIAARRVFRHRRHHRAAIALVAQRGSSSARRWMTRYLQDVDFEHWVVTCVRRQMNVVDRASLMQRSTQLGEVWRFPSSKARSVTLSPRSISPASSSTSHDAEVLHTAPWCTDPQIGAWLQAFYDGEESFYENTITLTSRLTPNELQDEVVEQKIRSARDAIERIAWTVFRAVRLRALSGEPTSAEQCLERQALHDPDDVFSRSILARWYADQGRTLDAALAWESAAKTTKYAARLAPMATRQAALLLEGIGDVERAHELVARACRSFPNDVALWRLRCAMAVRMRAHTEADYCWAMLLRLANTSEGAAELWLERYRGRRRDPEADSDAQHMLWFASVARPNDETILQGLREEALVTENYSFLRDALRRAHEAQADDVRRTELSSSIANLDAHELRPAQLTLAGIEEHLIRMPDTATLWLDKAETHAHLGRFDEVDTLRMRGVALGAPSCRGVIELACGFGHVLLNETGSALACFARATQDDHTKDFAWELIVDHHVRVGAEQAVLLSCLHQALGASTRPWGKARLHTLEGLVRRDAGDDQGAAESFAAALATRPTDAEAFAALRSLPAFPADIRKFVPGFATWVASGEDEAASVARWEELLAYLKRAGLAEDMPYELGRAVLGIRADFLPAVVFTADHEWRTRDWHSLAERLAQVPESLWPRGVAEHRFYSAYAAVALSLDDADEKLGMMLEVKPRHVPTLEMCAKRSLDRRDDDALAAVLAALTDAVDDHQVPQKAVTAWTHLSRLRARQGRLPEAKAAASRALTLAPDSLPVLEQYGRVSRLLDEPLVAAATYQKIASLALDRARHRALKMQANMLERASDFCGAAEVWTTVLADTQDAAHQQAANRCRWRQLLQEDLADGGGHEVPETELRRFEIESLRERGDLEAAEQACRRALETNPTDAALWASGIQLAQERGDALTLVERVERRLDLGGEPEMLSEWAALAGRSSRDALQDPTRAAALLYRAHEFDPDDLALRCELSALYVELPGMEPAAEIAVLQLIQRMPTSANSYALAEQLALRHGDDERAQAMRSAQDLLAGVMSVPAGWATRHAWGWAEPGLGPALDEICRPDELGGVTNHLIGCFDELMLEAWGEAPREWQDAEELDPHSRLSVQIARPLSRLFAQTDMRWWTHPGRRLGFRQGEVLEVMLPKAWHTEDEALWRALGSRLRALLAASGSVAESVPQSRDRDIVTFLRWVVGGATEADAPMPPELARRARQVWAETCSLEPWTRAPLARITVEDVRAWRLSVLRFGDRAGLFGAGRLPEALFVGPMQGAPEELPARRASRFCQNQRARELTAFAARPALWQARQVACGRMPRP